MKIITVCLKERASSIKNRMKEIDGVLKEADEKKVNASLVIFPGGTFDLKEVSLINPDKAKRIRLITNTGIIAPLKKMCKDHNLNIIFGIDTKDATDQCVCHVDESGIRCITRKIFPVQGDEANNWISNVEDAKIENRVTKIKGYRFLLAACYDMYGAEIIKDKNSKRLHNIQRLSKTNIIAAKKTSKFNEFKEEFVSNWCKSVDSSDIGVACIHNFTKEGEGSGISYWQRDGITNQYNYFKKKAILGAAHYVDGRIFPKDLTRALLADGKSIKKLHIADYVLQKEKALIRVWNI
jgi:hypothetical protein